MSDQADSQIQHASSEVYQKPVPWIAHVIVSIVILAIAFAAVAALFGTKPEARRWGDRPAPSVAVEVAPLEMQSYPVWVDSYGTAEPLTRSNLVSDLNARVVAVSPNIRAGKTFTAGEVLVTLEDRDFKVEVEVAASAAADAEVVYLQEVAQAEFAAQEWNEQPTSEAARKLALREPQVAAAKAALDAAKARLERAKLNLERTRIRAPFDGKVLAQNVDVGQVVSPSQAIAEIYSTDVVEVRLPVKIADLQHLTLPEANGDPNIRPKVVLETDLGNRSFQWQGEIVRTEGAFDPSTRMLYVVAHVIDPFVATNERPAMRIGQFVRAKLQGNLYDNVFVIPRRAVSQDFMVSVANEGFLEKRQVTPLWTDSNAVVVSADSYADVDFGAERQQASLTTSDMLILTPTANLPNGTRVKPLNPLPSEAETGNGEAIAAGQGGGLGAQVRLNQAAESDSAGAQATTSNSAK